jgi:hypothetical protein
MEAETDSVLIKNPVPKRYQKHIYDLAAQMREILNENESNPYLFRLFPLASFSDAEAAREYHSIVTTELLSSHFKALEVVQKEIFKAKVSRSTLVSWLKALNSIRLYLGTILDITPEGPADIKSEQEEYLYFAYLVLTGAQDIIIQALSVK